MTSKTLTKKLLTFYMFSQLISLFELYKTGLTQGAFQGMGDILFASLPINGLYIYILVQIYQIVFKNMDILKYASMKLLLLFYGDYLPKIAICVFAFLCYDGTIKMVQVDKYMVMGILIAVDICLEGITIMEFNKLEQVEKSGKKDNTIVVAPMKCTKAEYDEINKMLLYSLLGCCLPYGYILLYETRVYVPLYFGICVAIHWCLYRMFCRKQGYFQKSKYIFRAFLLEIVAYVWMLVICILEQTTVGRMCVVAMAIVMNLYWFFRIVYQLAKSSRGMELYLKS